MLAVLPITVQRLEKLGELVPVGGLEPPRLTASDFESLMSTNSITPAMKVAEHQVSV